MGFGRRSCLLGGGVLSWVRRLLEGLSSTSSVFVLVSGFAGVTVDGSLSSGLLRKASSLETSDKGESGGEERGSVAF